ncbi:Sel1 domain protein repeat-containing protein [Methylocella tundrae]|uniref:Sel1 domain protein repeat-containing protein n=1 Tax=Methylocella tundrae TaxID=227605 RepID=A0A4U8YVJ8_METTU|nr:Sel1 domain protein repeat-containing protein [Methylocella tundrae]
MSLLPWRRRVKKRNNPALSRLILVLCAGLAQAAYCSDASRAGGRTQQAQDETTEQNKEAAPQPSSPPKADENTPDLAFGAYQRGYYVTALAEAMKRIAANPDDAAAMTLVGELYAQGLGVRRDAKEAVRWYKLASDRGDRQATFRLALANLVGDGTAKDRDEAQKLFEKAAAQDHPGALYNLGVMAIENKGGVAPDFTKAAKLFEQAADLGDSDAAYALGLLYRNGTGVEKSDERAAEWIARSAKDNNVPAEIEYAIMLFNGVGVPKDETAAAKLFLKAAARDNPVAQNRAARVLAAGRGLPKDMVEAMKWHILARAAGVKDKWLDGELAKLTPKEKEAVQAAVRQYIGR